MMISGALIVSIRNDVNNGDSMANLALKYRPKTFEDVVEQDNVVNILKSMCKQPDLPNRNFLLVGPRGCGKAQPLHSKVLTPKGFVTMGSLSVGDLVYTSWGKIAEIGGIYPQGKRPIYAILLDDGSMIEVADNHLNDVCVWINDGSSDPSLIENIILETTDLYELRKYTPKGTIGLFVKCPYVDWNEDKRDIVDSYGDDIQKCLIEEDDILLSNFETRLHIISKLKPFSNLLDPDVDKHINQISIFGAKNFNGTKSKKLLKKFEFLFRSLGCVFRSVENDHGFYGYIDLTDKLCDRLGFIYENHGFLLRRIVDIKILPDEECQCIYVDHPDHTYISDGFIPTHNTTLGRIVANDLNEGKGQPIELDAASNSGVDTVRSIVEQAHQYPIGSKYKVFIADEVHAFSNTAWQSFLKILEEQPAKSVFILLTTDPEKIPKTIISRVQKFQLSTISLEGITNRLKHVIECENKDGRNITYEEDALSYIAKLAKGGLRDSLTLLDKALVYSDEITSINLKYALDIPEYDDYFALLNAFASKDNQKISEIVDRVYNSGTNFVKWFEGFQSFVINLAKYVFVGDISKTMIPSYYESQVKNYNAKHAQICMKLSQLLVELISKNSRTEYMEEIALSYLFR